MFYDNMLSQFYNFGRILLIWMTYVKITLLQIVKLLTF